MKKIQIIVVLLIVCTICVSSQNRSVQGSDILIDSAGVMRWKASEKEVALFGVNYTVPFAYSYRAHKKLGLSIRKAIDLDVAQFSRLECDAFRIHVWDREITDQDGNLLPNEHLDLLDYLLAQLAKKGFKTILTPIAWWGNGWPEPDERTVGFSDYYNKQELITNPAARQAQKKYLEQFLLHNNSYTGFSYKDDPSILAVEIINEPAHPEEGRITTEYINEMVDAIRHTGFTKPIFYNISQNWNDIQAEAVVNARIDGISFQWYPTDLVHNKMLAGNYLLNVDHYTIPSEKIAGYGTKTRMVYEFDAADIGGSYMYPAMARSFREAGMQFATMFSYDPVQIAWSNTEYQTHYLNLLYTPSKALSFMIAGKAFRQLPRMKSYGNYPENSRFENIRVSYSENLSEMNSDSEFIYSNTTQSTPKNSTSIRHIAGCGNSSLVQYEGTGAYFLDKLQAGIWRLEIYPDVLWLLDPFEKTSLSRQVARLFWREHTMQLNLPDLAGGYKLYSLSNGKKTAELDQQEEQRLSPGIYLVVEKNLEKHKLAPYVSAKEDYLDGIYVPPEDSPAVYIVNKTEGYVHSSKMPNFRFLIASNQEYLHPTLYLRRLGWRGFEKHPLNKIEGDEYIISDSVKSLKPGIIEYCVSFEVNGRVTTYPGKDLGSPDSWDFAANNYWTMKVLDPSAGLTVVDPLRDQRDIIFPHYTSTMKYSIDYPQVSNCEGIALRIDISFSKEKSSPFGFRFDVAKSSKLISEASCVYKNIVLRGRTLSDSSTILGMQLILSNGDQFVANVSLKKSWQDVNIPISAFYADTCLLLPNPYPLFLPKYRAIREEHKLIPQDLPKLDFIQFQLNAPTSTLFNIEKNIQVEIQSVRLE